MSACARASAIARCRRCGRPTPAGAWQNAGRTVHTSFFAPGASNARQGLGPALPKRHETRLKRRWTPSAHPDANPGFRRERQRGVHLRVTNDASSSRKRQRCAMTASRSTPSIHANASPMHPRDPPPNGKYEKRGRPFWRSGAIGRDRTVPAPESSSVPMHRPGTEHDQRSRRNDVAPRFVILDGNTARAAMRADTDASIRREPSVVTADAGTSPRSEGGPPRTASISACMRASSSG